MSSQAGGDAIQARTGAGVRGRCSSSATTRRDDDVSKEGGQNGCVLNQHQVMQRAGVGDHQHYKPSLRLVSRSCSRSANV